MGRLIDADALVERINDHKDNVKSGSEYTNNTYGLAHEHIIELVDNQKTAYDVEKVEEQIEEMFGVDPMYYGTEARWAVDKAIDIVKRGGVE